MSAPAVLVASAHPVQISALSGERQHPASGQVYYERLRHASIYYDIGRWQEHPIEASGVIERTPAFTLSARTLDHDVETFGYRVQETDQRTLLPDRLATAGIRGPAVRQLVAQGSLEVAGRVVTLDEVSAPRPGQSVAFVMDTRMCEAAVELARGVDLLVCESTYLAADADKAAAHGHLTAGQAATIAREAGVGQLVLTHFSQRYPENAPFVEEAVAIFPNVLAARDGDVVPMPKRQRAA